MNAFVEAFKNLDSETIHPILTGDVRETFEGDFEDVPEDVCTQMRQILRQMEVLSSDVVHSRAIHCALRKSRIFKN